MRGERERSGALAKRGGLLKRICAEDKEALDLIDQAEQGKQGARTDLVSNIHDVAARPAGTTRQRALRKLRKDRPDLHARKPVSRPRARGF